MSTATQSAFAWQPNRLLRCMSLLLASGSLRLTQIKSNFASEELSSKGRCG
jgi:hypothetical protein